MTANEHSKLLGIFFLIIAGFHALGGLFVLVVYGLLGFMFMATAKAEAAAVGLVFVIVAIVIGAILLAIAGLHFMSGWRLFKQMESSKVWATISSCLVLLSFPLGTALGVYGLWFLFGEQGKAFFSGQGANNYSPTQPPPPASWQ